MTVPMSVQENIRTLDSQGIPGREIARRLGVSRDAVAKYADQKDFSPAPAAPRTRPGGSVLVDFGQAEAIIAGIRQVVHIFLVTFPFSNMRFVQAYRGETAECVAHGLRTVFEHIGAVPRHMVFDNACL